MDIDQFKGKISVEKINYSQQELESIFQIKTRHAVDKVNKKMFIDALVMVFVSIGLISLSFALGLKNRIAIAGQIVSMGIILLVHYRLKYLLLNNSDFDKNTIQETIRKTYLTFKRYWIGYHVFVPFMVMILSFKIMTDLKLTLNPLTLFGLELSIGVLVLAITHVIVKKIYSKEFYRLKNIYERFN